MIEFRFCIDFSPEIIQKDTYCDGLFMEFMQRSTWARFKIIISPLHRCHLGLRHYFPLFSVLISEWVFEAIMLTETLHSYRNKVAIARSLQTGTPAIW